MPTEPWFSRKLVSAWASLFDQIPEDQKALLEDWLGTKAPDEVIAPSFSETVKKLGGKEMDREQLFGWSG